MIQILICLFNLSTIFQNYIQTLFQIPSETFKIHKKLQNETKTISIIFRFVLFFYFYFSMKMKKRIGMHVKLPVSIKIFKELKNNTKLN